MGPRPARAWILLAWAVVVSSACGGDVAAPGEGSRPARVVVEPGEVLLVGVGDTATLEVRALDGSGRTLPGGPASWSVDAPAVASVDAGGRLRALAAGRTVVRAEVAGVTGTARVEVHLPQEPDAWEPGVAYTGRRGYAEYVPGTLPLVLSAPHGGDLEPPEIPDRTAGVTVTDRNTREVLLAVRAALVARTGRAPHVVVSHLDRAKLDPNRDLDEAAQGSPYAEQAWREYHGFIEVARETVTEAYGSGLYLDLHGHGHDIPRVELGYLLDAEDLAGSDAGLDALAGESSVRALHARAGGAFSALIRGPSSLGTLLADRGLRSVPSAFEPSPGTEPYFTGGYSTRRHGSRDPGEVVSGVQLELPFPGVRDTPASRAAFAAALAEAVGVYMETWYGFYAPAVAYPPTSSAGR